MKEKEKGKVEAVKRKLDLEKEECKKKRNKAEEEKTQEKKRRKLATPM